MTSPWERFGALEAYFMCDSLLGAVKEMTGDLKAQCQMIF